MVQTDTLVLWQILLPKPNLTIFKTNLSCATFAHFWKQFVMLPPLNFSTSAFRVSIGMWQSTILLILKSISELKYFSFLICGSFSSSHVSDVCNGYFCWTVFSVLPMCVGSCTVTVGCPCGQPLGHLAGLSFFEVSLNFRLVDAWAGVLVWVPENYNAFLWPSLRSFLIPPQKDESRCLQQI